MAGYKRRSCRHYLVNEHTWKQVMLACVWGCNSFNIDIYSSTLQDCQQSSCTSKFKINKGERDGIQIFSGKKTEDQRKRFRRLTILFLLLYTALFVTDSKEQPNRRRPCHTFVLHVTWDNAASEYNTWCASQSQRESKSQKMDRQQQLNGWVCGSPERHMGVSSWCSCVRITFFFYTFTLHTNFSH